MPHYSSPSRRIILLLVVAGTLFFTITEFRSLRHSLPGPKPSAHEAGDLEYDGKSLLTGHAIAPKLGNETAKAELGRAAWKLFHTTFARFPDKPTKDESAALWSYVHLFQRLYPCGECATHFGEILERFPPQVSSRSAAAAWGCHVHNQVNRSLKKETFDCSKIGDFYDCGCADDEEDKAKGGTRGGSHTDAQEHAIKEAR